MRLYAFQPNGHGESSFFTIAENEEKAINNVNKYIKKNFYDIKKIDFKYYKLTVIEENGVIENDNN